MTHFSWLQSRAVFQSMGTANGVPQLVLGSGKSQTDPYSLGVFCRIMFDYFVENDPAVSKMNVIDGASGQLFAIVDVAGFHPL
jgi:hypothetical protein